LYQKANSPLLCPKGNCLEAYKFYYIKKSLREKSLLLIGPRAGFRASLFQFHVSFLIFPFRGGRRSFFPFSPQFFYRFDKGKNPWYGKNPARP
jgi:hypothetical protein